MKAPIQTALLVSLLFALPCRAEQPDILVVTFHPQCPGGGGPESLGGIVGALGKVAIGGVIDWVGTLAKAQGEDKSEGVGKGIGYNTFFEIDGKGQITRTVGCLSILRPGRGSEPPAPDSDAARVLARMTGLLKAEAKNVTAAPDFYADFEIVSFDGHQDVFALRILNLYLGHTNISGWSKRERGIDIAISFSVPGSPQQPFASAMFSFSDLEPGKLRSRDNDSLFRSTSGLLPAPPFQQDEQIWVDQAKDRNKEILAYNAAEKLRFQHTAYTEKSPRPLALDTKKLGLINATVTVTENRAGSQFWAAIASAFQSKKDELNTAAVTTLIPEERRAAQLEQESTSITKRNLADSAYSDYLAAKLDAEDKGVALAQLKDNVSFQEKSKATTALLQAQIAANIAARTARIVPLPFPEVVLPVD
jgi:hypothetical protein